jgi:hypothetical protein
MGDSPLLEMRNPNLKVVAQARRDVVLKYENYTIEKDRLVLME